MSKMIHKIPAWAQTFIALMSLVISGYVWASSTFVSKDTMQVVMTIISETHKDVRELREDVRNLAKGE